MVYFFLSFESGDLTGTDESLVVCYKGKRWSVWTSKPVWAMAVKKGLFVCVVE